MSKNNYEKTMDKIKTTEKFQNDMITKLKDPLENEVQRNNKKIKYDYRKIGTLAAGLIFIIIIGLSINILNKSESQIVNESNDPSNIYENNDYYLDSTYLANLPKLELSMGVSDGKGFGALMAYNIDELKDSNPWTDDNDLKSMPVFKNKGYYNSDPTGRDEVSLSGDEMLSKANEVAKIMNINIVEAYTMPTQKEIEAYEEKTGQKANLNPYMAIIKGDGVEINVNSLGRVGISFTPAKKLPDKYSFTFEKITANEAEKTMEYLLNEYSYITRLKSPAISLARSYTFNGEETFGYNAFENEGTLLDKILKYNFNTVRFSPTDNGGELSSIYIDNTDISELIGNYPIITADEAKELLLNGKYITSVPEDVPGEEYVASVSLIYRNSSRQEYFMPYYEFLVEIPSMKQENGLNNYGIYYVPAVEEEYISNMPKYDGSFN